MKRLIISSSQELKDVFTIDRGALLDIHDIGLVIRIWVDIILTKVVEEMIRKCL